MNDSTLLFPFNQGMKTSNKHETCIFLTKPRKNHRIDILKKKAENKILQNKNILVHLYTSKRSEKGKIAILFQQQLMLLPLSQATEPKNVGDFQ